MSHDSRIGSTFSRRCLPQATTLGLAVGHHGRPAYGLACTRADTTNRSKTASRLCLAAHLRCTCARLTSARERNDLACTLRVACTTPRSAARFTAHVPVQADAVRLCAEVISAVCNRLEDPFPVRARGVARLRILLSDGRGPLYRTGRGTLGAALRGVLAAL